MAAHTSLIKSISDSGSGSCSSKRIEADRPLRKRCQGFLDRHRRVKRSHSLRAVEQSWPRFIERIRTRPALRLRLSPRVVLAERLIEALGKNRVCIVGSSWIHRPRFGVVHPCFPMFPAQMGWMVRDVASIFDKRVNPLWCPRLLFENVTGSSHCCGMSFGGRSPSKRGRRPSTPPSAVSSRSFSVFSTALTAYQGRPPRLSDTVYEPEL